MRHLRNAAKRLSTLVLAAVLLGGAPVDDSAAAVDEQLRIEGLRVSGGETSWHSENDFKLEWELPALRAGTNSISAVNYLVRDTSGVAVGPIDRTVGARESVHAGIPSAFGGPGAVPGRYTVEVWLESGGDDGPHATATLLFDDERPGPARALSPAVWIRAGTNVVLNIKHPTTVPISGIRGYAVAIDHGSGSNPCAGVSSCSEAETDLRAGIDDDVIPLGPLSEGVNVVNVVAVSGSGRRSATESTELQVDGTRPSIVFDGAVGGWSNGPVEVAALAADSLSGMTAAGPSGPLTAISVDGGAEAVASGNRVTTTVWGEGTHHLLAHARDAAGNTNDAEPSSALVRIDEQPPRIAFANSQDPSEPERIEATISDELSGPDGASGSIAVRAVGASGSFAPLPTRASGGRLTALWHSDDYPAGSYEFRAGGSDAAGNMASTGRRSNGSRMVLANPLKRPTSLELGFGGHRMVWHRCTRSSIGVRCRRQVIVAFERRPAMRSARYGSSAPVAGRLMTTSGVPVTGQVVEVREAFAHGSAIAQRTATVRTGDDGVFVARLAPGPSREVAVSFPGSATLTRAASRSLHLSVPAAVHLRASTAVATVGGPAVVFSGKIARADAAIPPDGRPIQLQFRLAGRPWSEFRTVQTDAQGRFRYPYTFSDDDSRGIRFQFRAYAPPQPDWPYEPGASRPVAVTGR